MLEHKHKQMSNYKPSFEEGHSMKQDLFQLSRSLVFLILIITSEIVCLIVDGCPVYLQPVSRSSFSTQNPIPDVGSHGRSTQTPRNTRHISSLPIQDGSLIGHNMNVRPSYWLWGECDQPLGPDRHHIQRSHNLLLISPSYSDQDGKLSTYQNASIHFMTFDRVWTLMGTKCPSCIPEGEKYMMWWWWGFLSSIWGKPQLIHIWPQEEEENEIVSCAWLWVILTAVRSIALGHVVGRCDKTKMS